MRQHLRDFIFRRLIVATLACALAAGTGVALCGTIVFQRVISSAEAAAYREAQDRFNLFDLFISRIEAENRGNGRLALAELARRYPTLASARAVGSDGLRRVARELGVSELYFISSGCVIESTSFPPDQGLDFNTIGNPAFLAFLKAQFGAGRFVDQRVSLSSVTGEANNYQYYGPPGAEFVIEVSTRLSDTVPRIFPGMDYAGLVDIMFRGESEGSQVPLVSFKDCLFVSASAINSIASERKVDPDVERVVRRAELGGGTGELSRGDRLLKVRKLSLELRDFDYADISYAVFEFDRRPLRIFLLASAAVALLAGVGIAWISFLALRSSFVKRFAGRIEGLEHAMAGIGAGVSTESLDDGADDEISSIGRSAEAMVSEIRARSVELATFARRLEEEIGEGDKREKALQVALDENKALVREVNHRVKNNLQVMLSLIGFQTQNALLHETKEALARTRTRLFAMSLVQDQLLKTSSLAAVNMQELLEDIVASVYSAAFLPGAHIDFSIDAGGIRCSADVAMAVSLAVSELVDNACRHAFRGEGNGTVKLLMSGLAGKGLNIEVADDGNGRAAPGGIGMEIVRALAEQLGGRVETEIAEGAGTTVRIVVPG